MASVVLGDGLIDHLARRTEFARIMPRCYSILRAGWREVKGCGSCKRGIRVSGSSKVLDVDARNRFRDCLTKQDAESVARLKRLLQVDTIIIYTRSTGKLSTVRL